MRTTVKMHDTDIPDTRLSKRRLRSKVASGKVAKNVASKTRKLVTKTKTTKSGVNKTSTQSAGCNSTKTDFQVTMDESVGVDSSMITPPALVIDEDIVCDDGNNKNIVVNVSDTGMGLSYISKEETNELVYAILNDVSVTAVLPPPKINPIEAITTSNSEQEVGDMSLDEEKIRNLLTEALSSTKIDAQTDPTGHEMNSNGHKSRRCLNDSRTVNSTSTQPKYQHIIPSTLRLPSLNHSSTAKSSAARLSSIDRIQSSCANSNFVHARAQSAYASETRTIPVHLAKKQPISRSTITTNHTSQINDNTHDRVALDQVKQNILILQALPEYRGLEREVKLLKKKVKQWAHDYEILEKKYEELQSNSFPRPTADGYEFLIQLVDSLGRARSDEDPCTNVQIASDLNLDLEQLIALEHEDTQRTALNILHALFPTNKEKADLIGIRHLVTMYSDLLRTIYVFARRSSPTPAFSMRQLRNAFGTAIRQARHKENISNKNVLVLGEALMKATTDNNSLVNSAKTCNVVRYNVHRSTPDLDGDSSSDLDDE